MTPRRRAELREARDQLQQQITPLLERLAYMDRMIAMPDEPLATEWEAAVEALAEIERSLSSWERDIELCDGLDDGPPMRIPDSVFREKREAEARVARAQAALRGVA